MTAGVDLTPAFPDYKYQNRRLRANSQHLRFSGPGRGPTAPQQRESINPREVAQLALCPVKLRQDHVVGWRELDQRRGGQLISRAPTTTFKVNHRDADSLP